MPRIPGGYIDVRPWRGPDPPMIAVAVRKATLKDWYWPLTMREYLEYAESIAPQPVA